MPKYCPKCGIELKYHDADFCDNCGFKLIQDDPRPEIKQEDTFKVNNDLIKDDEPVSNVSLKDLGRKLEEVVEKILRAQGYSTKRNQFIKTVQGLTREVDILAKKVVNGREILMAVECKNYSNPVPLKDMEYFVSLLEQTNIKIGLFATSSSYTEQAMKKAQMAGIKTWDYEDIKDKHIQASIGRLKTVNKEFFKRALPEKISFLDATKLDLLNADKVNIIYADLIWKPYNKIVYNLSGSCRTPDKKVHKIKDKGVLIVDALEGDIIDSKSSYKERLVKKELLKKTPQINLTINQQGNYKIKKINPNVTRREVIRRSIHRIINDNTRELSYQVKRRQRRKVTSVDYDPWDGPEIIDEGYETEEYYETKYYTYVPKKREIFLKSIDLIYIPKWEIEFSSGEYTYTREILASNGTKITDQISICPKHKVRNFLKISPKQTIAVCEVCGISLCDRDIFQCPKCGKWLCEEHAAFCVNCSRYYCNDHIDKFCEKCKTPLCNDCDTNCPICGNDYCKKHMVTCDVCGKKVCIDCVDVSRKKLLFKKYTCKNCIE